MLVVGLISLCAILFVLAGVLWNEGCEADQEHQRYRAAYRNEKDRRMRDYDEDQRLRNEIRDLQDREKIKEKRVTVFRRQAEAWMVKASNAEHQLKIAEFEITTLKRDKEVEQQQRLTAERLHWEQEAFDLRYPAGKWPQMVSKRG